MVNEIISYLNTRLSLTNLFEFQYGICELVHEKEQVRPMQYCSNGEWKEVSNFDKFNGVSYWRKNGNISNSIIEGNISCAKFQNIELPLKLICVVPRSKMVDNAYTGDSIASIINNQLTESSAQLKSTLKARKVNITVASYNTDSHSILNEEYDNIQVTDLSFKYAYISIDVTVTIDINVSCIVLECDTADACTNLLRSLTKTEKLDCILPDYDFSVDQTYNSLTANQITDLSERFQTFSLKGVFPVNCPDLQSITIDADNAGTYTVEAQDGASGTLTYSINGGAYAAFSNPTTLAVNDTIIAKRTVFSAIGFYKLTGTY